MKIRIVLIFCFSMALALPARAQEKAYDLVITGAVVADGSGARPRVQDVAVNRDRIAAVGRLSPEDARQVIRADGLYLLPGLVDVHTHSDFNAWVYPGLANKVFQGVTSEIAGNCGMSAAPVLGSHGERIGEVWGREGVRLPGKVPWKTFAQYQSWHDRHGLMTNLGVLVGHGNLRSAVMGFESRAASDEEIAAMQAALSRSLEEGALGVSFGLIYLPGIAAEEKELTALCRTAAAYQAVCAFHMRNEGSRLLESLDEVIRIGKASGARIEISHLKAAGQGNWDKIGGAFQKIEEARAAGLEIHADAYPYEGSFAELGVVLPDELYTRKDRNDFFADAARREELLNLLTAYYREHPRSWSSVMVATVKAPEDKGFQGKRLAAIAEEEGLKPEAALAGLLARSGFEVSAFFFSQSPEVIHQVLEKPYVSGGSDSIADGSDYPHPRAYGTFARLLAAAFKERDSGSLGRFARQHAAEPAAFFGLRERGRIEPGYYADLVVVDPASVADLATYEHPKTLSRGFVWVIINGVPVIAEGRLRDAERAGRFLAR